MTNTCATCLYFSRINGGKGECRRHAPRPVLTATLHAPPTIWPTVSSGDGCGEWRVTAAIATPTRSRGAKPE